ncbi:UDP-N-acetyl glucosamine 2-epimerase, partial [bacterium]|nr:UDP-N-acetyl glucosamine 2-epimerase [bacterium]
NSKFVLTDSGGIQEETTVLNIPCLTLRKNTERPITVKQGTNIVVGFDPRKIVRESIRIINEKGRRGKIPPLWEGKAAQRIVKVLLDT